MKGVALASVFGLVLCPAFAQAAGEAKKAKPAAASIPVPFQSITPGLDLDTQLRLDLAQFPPGADLQGPVLDTLREAADRRAVLSEDVVNDLAERYRVKKGETRQDTLRYALKVQPRLSAKAFNIILGGLAEFDWAKQEGALEILGRQPSLPDSARPILEASLASSDREMRAISANLLLTADPAHAGARRTLRDEQDARYTSSRFNDAHHETMLGDIWRDVLPRVRHIVLSEDAYQEAARMHPGEFSRYAWMDLMDRLRLYTASPRRAAKAIFSLIHSREPVDDSTLNALFRAPERASRRDFEFKHRALAALRESVDEALAQDFAQDIHGLMVVGSLAHHPTPESDIDILIVSGDDPRGDPKAFRQAVAAGMKRRGYANAIDFLGTVSPGTLAFSRQLSHGSLFFGRP